MSRRSAIHSFYLLVGGYSLSAFGTFLNMVALNLFAYSVTGSALMTGLFMALRLVASFLMGLVAGRLVARYNRKTLMILSDLTQGAALVLLVLAPAELQGKLLYGLSIVFGLFSTLSSVSLRSSIPEMVGQEHLVRANGLLVTGRSLAMVFGFASASLIVSWAGYSTAFLLDAGTFVLSALNLALLPLNTRAAPQQAPAAGSPPAPGFLQSHQAALAILKTVPVLLVMILIRTADAFGSASHQVGIPVYANLVNPQAPSEFMGRFWAAWAVGSLLAYKVLARHLKGDGWLSGEKAFAIGTCFMSSFFILVFTGLPLPFLLLVGVGAGLADGFTEIAYSSRLQTVPDEQRGYLFGFTAMAESSGLGLGMLLSASLLEKLPPLYVVGLSHGTAIAMALGFLLLLASKARRLSSAEGTSQS
jgi:MFS family permease